MRKRFLQTFLPAFLLACPLLLNGACTAIAGNTEKENPVHAKLAASFTGTIPGPANGAGANAGSTSTDAAGEGEVTTGWKQVGKKVYYYDENGKKLTGLQKIDGEYYYFNGKGVRKTGWIKVKGVMYYFDPHRLKKSTVKQLLQTALQPVGSTLYIWGGGWNKADTGAGTSAVTIGVSKAWKTFFDSQNSAYNYNNYRYQITKGLDCSGYVGWVLYNTFNTGSGNTGYVMAAEKMARTFAGYGWGKYTAPASVKNFKAGDIMSLSSGHVYIVVGQCADGSVVLLHASPPGVMLSGTPTRTGNKNSQAVKLASSYMKKYFPAFYARYPDTSRNSSYLTRFGRMRWYVGKKKSLLTDPEKLRGKNAKKVLAAIFEE